MSGEIIQSVVNDNYDNFGHVNFNIFTKFHFIIFEDYLMAKLIVR
jgi:hypothetical protein